MMSLVATIKTAAAVVTSIGVIGGGAFVLDERHALRSEFDTHMQSDRVKTILDLVNTGQQERADWICNAIEQELIELCTENSDHYLCGIKTQRALKSKAGCS